MSINKNNYEAFFLDYHEGNLSPQQVADLLLFLEQHPQLKEEFESFENFTLEDSSVIKFENKNELKRAIATDDLLIASMEGLLTKEESNLFNQQLLKDTKMQKEFALYQKTKLTVDTSIVFENKNSLKHKDKKVVPLFYYVAIAASIVLLMGLFFMFNNDSEQKLADKEVPSLKFKVESLVNENSSVTEVKKEKDLVNPSELSALVVNKKVKSQKLKVKSLTNEKSITEIKEKEDLVNLNALVVNKEVESQKLKVKSDNEQELANNKQQTTNEKPLIAQLEKKDEVIEPKEILSLREIAVVKIKEKALDETTLAAEKKTGRLKKLSGWDIAQLAAKGFNKLTGRNVEVKPTYNTQGDITAYSLGAGEFQISRGR